MKVHVHYLAMILTSIITSANSIVTLFIVRLTVVAIVSDVCLNKILYSNAVNVNNENGQHTMEENLERNESNQSKST